MLPAARPARCVGSRLPVTGLLNRTGECPSLPLTARPACCVGSKLPVADLRIGKNGPKRAILSE